MNIVDRILTVLVTATLTSAVWIVAGGSLIELADSRSGEDSQRPADAAPSPTVSDTATPLAGNGDGTETALVPASLDTDNADSPAGGNDDNLAVPVHNVRPSDLTNTYLNERGGGSRLHEAIDIMAPEGTSVIAAAPGQVEKLFRSNAGGNTIYVRSTDGRTIYYYAHLAEYAEGLTEGQRVRRGQRIGTVGSTGNADPTAPHLHFAIMRTTKDAEWWEPANALNPYDLLTQNR